MKNILLVGIGGFAGSVLRYLVAIGYKPTGWTFPWHTFTVNMVGSLLIGVLFAFGAKSDNLVKLLLVTGFCGGFTTFSTFSFENLKLMQEGYIGTALVYMLASVVLGIVLVMAGYYFTEKLIL